MENNALENEIVAETEELQPDVQQPSENKPDLKAFVNNATDKAKDLYENRATLFAKIKAIPRKIWMLAGAGILALIAVIVVLSLLGNTYKTPIATAEKLLNMKSVEKIIDKAPSLLNGFGEKDAEKILKIIKKSDMYKDAKETMEDGFEDLIDGLKDQFGSNYKIKIKVEEKDKLEKDDLKEFRDQLREISALTKELDDLESDDYEDLADEIGISKAKAKDIVKILQAFGKECKTAKVSKGYELSLVLSITGSELDEPQELDLTVRVFKVDGRWVPDVFSLANLLDLDDLLYLF